MRFRLLGSCGLAVAALLALFPPLLGAQTTASGSAGRTRLSTADLAKKLTPSVVTVTTPATLGSGVILDTNGLIVTNLHVVRGQSQASIKVASGDVYDDVSVVDVDARRDLVLLKIKAFGLAPATVGNSDLTHPGDHVLLIGSPQGYETTISDGLISGFRDTGEGYRLLQTSAAASHGSSGGGMFNEFGELVGILTLTDESGQNLNFALPVNYVRGLAATQRPISLAELAAKLPAVTRASPPAAAGAGSTPSAPPDPAAVARLTTLLSSAQIQATRTGDKTWTASYGGGTNLKTISVALVLDGELLVIQSPIAPSKGLTATQLAALLELDFSLNLAKVSIYDGQVIALNETELRLLDGPALQKIVSAVGLCADNVAGTLQPNTNPAPSAGPSAPSTPVAGASSNSPAAVESVLDGHIQLTYDGTFWTRKQVDASTADFQNPTADVFVRVTTTRIEVPLDRAANLELDNIRKTDPSARLSRSGYKTINGLRVFAWEAEATIGGVPFTYYTQVYSDAQGTVELTGWTSRNLIDQARRLLDSFSSTLRTQRDSVDWSQPSPRPSAATAPVSSPSTSATTGHEVFLDGQAWLDYDPALWTRSPLEQVGAFLLTYKTGDVFVKVSAGRYAMQLEKIADIELANVKKIDPNAHLIKRSIETLKSNGLRVASFQIVSVTDGVEMWYYEQCYSGAVGTVQVVGYTASNLMNQAGPLIDKIVDRLVISR